MLELGTTSTGTRQMVCSTVKATKLHHSFSEMLHHTFSQSSDVAEHCYAVFMLMTLPRHRAFRGFFVVSVTRSLSSQLEKDISVWFLLAETHTINLVD